jgi:hypothetical protein
LKKERNMGEQQSKKRGLRSESQKEVAARDAYAPIPPANPVGGAFGGHKPGNATDEELSLAYDARLARNQAKRPKK